MSMGIAVYINEMSHKLNRHMGRSLFILLMLDCCCAGLNR